MACKCCGGQAVIRSRPAAGKGFLVWVTCTSCGARTREYKESVQPTEDTPGAKWAALAWNSGDQAKPIEKRCKHGGNDSSSKRGPAGVSARMEPKKQG